MTWLNIKEAARYANVSESKINRLVRQLKGENSEYVRQVFDVKPFRWQVRAQALDGLSARQISSKDEPLTRLDKPLANPFDEANKPVKQAQADGSLSSVVEAQRETISLLSKQLDKANETISALIESKKHSDILLLERQKERIGAGEPHRKPSLTAGAVFFAVVAIVAFALLYLMRK